VFHLSFLFPAAPNGWSGEACGCEEGYGGCANDLSPLSAGGRRWSGRVEKDFDRLPLIHSLAPEHGIFGGKSRVNEVTDLSGRVGAALIAVDVNEVDLLLNHRSGMVAGCVEDSQGSVVRGPSFSPDREIRGCDGRDMRNEMLFMHAVDGADERLARQGAEVLTDAELVGFLLRPIGKGIDGAEVGRRLLDEHGSLVALSRMGTVVLAQAAGVNVARAGRLSVAFELAVRLGRESVLRQAISSPEAVFRLLGAEMRMLSKESLRVVLLDARHQLMRVQQISLGSLNHSIAHPRDVLEPVIRHAAYGFILVHNHPSGDPSPSESDRMTTQRIREAAGILQVSFLDHVILGEAGPSRSGWFSFRESGWM
jgi:DNA repair protein RadC